ncbi:hypothetical protein GA0115240_11078 [Streptomyces sp. DvalAA-14]|uniref:hypothetical protein n=1 Tax=unclassified Streptomyces TaxID=2593676 RepID=UPI00081B934E|nr:MULTISPECIES: hypothetical protein [unclassified Streptomyces]SCD48407.1 hypothetical protein GA0115240_11078 [Streptomyces sp. DvalAA-14]
MSGDESPEGGPVGGPSVASGEWYAVRNAATSLRDVLTASGMQRDFPYLWADINAFGQGFIELGRVSPETAGRLAGLVRLALSSHALALEAGGGGLVAERADVRRRAGND